MEWLENLEKEAGIPEYRILNLISYDPWKGALIKRIATISKKITFEFARHHEIQSIAFKQDIHEIWPQFPLELQFGLPTMPT